MGTLASIVATIHAVCLPEVVPIPSSSLAVDAVHGAPAAASSLILAISSVAADLSHGF